MTARSLGAGSAGDVEDVDALTVVLRRGALNVRSEDESRHEAQARAILASDWLAAHVASAPTADRERVARVEALPGGSASVSLHSLRAALAAPHVEPDDG